MLDDGKDNVNVKMKCIISTDKIQYITDILCIPEIDHINVLNAHSER